jgi:hypothetical protein
MSFTRWLRNLQAVFHLRNTSGNSRRAGRNARPRFRPRLEVLEGRLAPAVLTVNSVDDTVSSTTSTLDLREAILLVNSGGRATDSSNNSLSAVKGSQIDTSSGDFGTNDTIQFALGPNSQTITLNGAELFITKDLSIVGPSAGALTVSGNHASRVFAIGPGLKGPATVSLSGLTIANGTDVDGGGIFTGFGVTLTVTNCKLLGNSATVDPMTRTGGDGGGIFNFADSTLTVTNSILSDNSAALYGGGIFNDGTATVTNSTLLDNSASTGGGIDNDSGTVTVTNSLLDGNTATLGGGIYNNSSATVTVVNSALAHNKAQSSANAIGGGIYNLGTLHVTDSTLLDNTADDAGGGVFSDATATMTNCTVSGNSANGLGTAGGIDTSTYGSDASTTLVNCTVAYNTNFNPDGGPGGLFAGSYLSGQATVTLGNTIVAENSGNQFGTAGGVAPGTFISQGHNLSSDASGNLTQSGDQQNTDPLLGPLQDNGGQQLAGAPGTQVVPGSQVVVPTMALLPGSPAIDRGSILLAKDPATGIQLSTDERGFDRVVNSAVDIGAFEVQLYLVYSTADDNGGGTLRTALNLAKNAGGSVIDVITGGTIDLAKALPDITRSVQIAGPGPDDLTVERSTAAGTPPFRIFTVAPPTGGIHDVTVAISGMTIANGNYQFAGGILNQGALTVSNCTLSGNTAQFEGGGIGNYNGGTATVINSSLSGNTASLGGGIFNYNGRTVTVTNSTFSGNTASSGGGIASESGTMTVTNSTFSGNTATIGGGGIFNNSSGTVTVVNSTLAGNTATVAGGGIYNVGTLYVTDSTVAGNTAGSGGGGIITRGTAIVTNCTVSGNTANALDTAGGIDTSSDNPDASSMLVNCTVAGNTNLNAAGPGGLFAGRYGTGQATVTLGNTIVADNSGNQLGTAGATVGPGTFVSNGNNLISDKSASRFAVLTDLPPQEPLLAPLGNYGGPTQTMALLPGSPAIDAGSKDLAVDPAGNTLTTDQRGFDRIVGIAVDIGAFESRGFTIRVYSGNNQLAIVNTPFAAPLTVTVSSAVGEPVQGGVVAFAVQPSGASASATFPGDAAIDASGHASVSAIANANAGTYQVFASAHGANQASFTLTNLTPIVLGLSGLPDATAGATYSQTLTASGGAGGPYAGGPYTFAVTAGAMPRGFSLSTSGVLIGSPTVAGTSSFTVTATDTSSGFTASQVYTLTVDPGEAKQFVITAPNNVGHGTSFSITVTAVDANGNVATEYLGKLNFASSDKKANLPGTYAFTASDRGVHTFTGLVLRGRGMQTITVLDASNNIVGTISVYVS